MAVDSVLNQTFSDFELILVNDGSTDGSAELANEYAKKDSRIKVYHVENAGAANARNVGLSHATGDYIAFMDSDDRLDATYLEALYTNAIAQNADVAVCTYYRYLEKDTQYSYYIWEKEPDTVLYNAVDFYNKYSGANNSLRVLFEVPWAKLFRRSLFDAISFPKGKYFEDAFTMYKAYFKSDRIVVVNQPLYMYRVRENGLNVHPWNRMRMHDAIEWQEERMALLTFIGVPVNPYAISEYYHTLQEIMENALNSGFLEEYQWAKHKWDFFTLRGKYNEKNN